MRRTLELIGSLKITVGLLVVMLVVLSAGTIVESLHGREAAAQVYGSTGFFALLAVFAVNLVASIASKWPWGRMRIGFIITHLAMVVILIGSMMTEFVKVDGRLALWEGQSSDSLFVAGEGDQMVPAPLGFTFRLDAFEIDHYPGTLRPAMFRSRVTVTDPSTGFEEQRVIEMNRELTWGGFKFFQSSYQIEQGREMSILSVSRDPGQNIVFVGYFMLVLGMLVVLITRIQQRRSLGDATFPGSGPMVTPVKITLAALLALGMSGSASAQEHAKLDELRAVPVQHDGRIMPLDTLARESVWKVTGVRRWYARTRSTRS